jgi:hypothetical protein
MMVWMLVGVLIAFFNLLNRNDSDAILNIEQDTPVADPHPVSVFLAGQSFHVSANRPASQRFHRIVNPLPDLPAADFVKLLIALARQSTSYMTYYISFNISYCQEKNRA